MMASYHVWAYRQLMLSLNNLPDDEYFDNSVKLFFGSIHGTVNHLYLVDKLWYGRFIGEQMAIVGLDQELYQNRQMLSEALIAGADRWLSYINDATIEELNQETAYSNSKNKAASFLPTTTLLHVFNHGTHHRGQISGALTKFNRSFEVMDLFYCPAYRDMNSFKN